MHRLRLLSKHGALPPPAATRQFFPVPCARVTVRKCTRAHTRTRTSPPRAPRRSSPQVLIRLARPRRPRARVYSPSNFRRDPVSPASAAHRGEDTRTPDTNTVLFQCTVGSSSELWEQISPTPASTSVGATFLYPVRRRNLTAAHGVRHTLFAYLL